MEDELLELAIEAARRAGALLLEHFSRPFSGISSKSTPTDLVSDADRAADELLTSFIGKARPTDGIVTEESAGSRGTSGLSWVVDPLDGTINFLFRRPAWCVSIAIEDESGGIVGVVYDPMLDELFTALRGRGSLLNEQPMVVSSQRELSQALVGTGFAYDSRARSEQATVLQRVLPEARDIRRTGSAALDLAYVACGRLDGFYEAPMEAWDRAAGVVLIRESGGVVEDLPAPYGLSTGVIASNPVLHPALSALVLA